MLLRRGAPVTSLRPGARLEKRCMHMHIVNQRAHTPRPPVLKTPPRRRNLTWSANLGTVHLVTLPLPHTSVAVCSTCLVCSPFRRLFAHAHACFPSVRSLDTRAHRGRSSRRRTLQGRCLRAVERPARHEPSSPLRRWAPRRSRWAPGLPPPRPRARRS